MPSEADTPGRKDSPEDPPPLTPTTGKKEKTELLRDSNIVFVGKKPAMSYAMAVVTQFSSGNTEVHVKARGKSISRAVDVAEVVKNRFVQNLNYDITTGTENVRDDQGNDINISTISIKLSK